MRRPRFQIQFDGKEPVTPPATDFPPITYVDKSDVPLPAQHTMRDLFNSGRSVAWLSHMFELPEEWIVFYVLYNGEEPLNS